MGLDRVMPSGRVREISSDVMIGALSETRTVQAAAELIECSAPSIHNRAKEEVPVKLAVRAQDEKLEDSLAEAIIRNRGVISKIAADVGMQVGSVYYSIRKKPSLQTLMQEARERIIDQAEDNIFDRVEIGDYQASVFVVRTLGKDRGYTERKEIDSQVTHTIESSPTDNLVNMLNNLASQQPELVEAEFSDLPTEDRKLLSAALNKHSSETEVE